MAIELLEAWIVREMEISGSSGQREVEKEKGREKEDSSEGEEELNPEPEVEYRGILREMRETEWRKDLRQRKILILDGKHVNRRAKFLYWSGTVAYVRMKGEVDKIGIPIDREVLVLAKKR